MITASLHSDTDGNKYKNPNRERRFINGYYEIGGKRIAYLNSRLNSLTDLQDPEKISKIGSSINFTQNKTNLNSSDIPSAIATPRIDSLSNYTEDFRNGTITHDQMGKVQILILNEIINYPDFINFDKLTQFRVAMSLVWKMGVTQDELPYKKIYELYNKYKPTVEEPASLKIQKLLAARLINNKQVNYANIAQNIINKNVTAYVNEDKNLSPINIEGILSGLETVINQVENDDTLSKDQSKVLLNALSSTKYLVNAINNTIVNNASQGNLSDSNNSHKAAGKGGILSGIGDVFNAFWQGVVSDFNHWNPCIDCIFKNLHKNIDLGDIIYIFLIMTVVAAAALGDLVPTPLPTGGTTSPLSWADVLVGAISSGLYITGTIFYTALTNCLVQCNLKKSDIPQCTTCPDDVYTRFDGANCMYGWYAGVPASPCPAFILGYGFNYCHYGAPPYLSPSTCADGNISAPFWMPGPGLVRNPASYGHWDGAHCNFGWWDPGWTPFIAGTGFYVKPKC